MPALSLAKANSIVMNNYILRENYLIQEKLKQQDEVYVINKLIHDTTPRRYGILYHIFRRK